jgi:hypothetical protein
MHVKKISLKAPIKYQADFTLAVNIFGVYDVYYGAKSKNERIVTTMYPKIRVM